MANRVFSLAACPVAIGNIIVKEFAEGSDVITLDLEGEDWDIQSDLVSDIAIKKPNRKGVLTLKIAQGAPENQALIQKRLTCLASDSPWIPISFSDGHGTTRLSCVGTFGKIPKVGFGTAASPLEWSFKVTVQPQDLVIGQNF